LMMCRHCRCVKALHIMQIERRQSTGTAQFIKPLFGYAADHNTSCVLERCKAG
jgi:hypothetical protein